MISAKVYDSMFGLIEENYGKTISPAIRAIWKEYINEHLTDAEFIASVKHAILHSRFMPTAGDLVEHINGGKEAKAITEWQTVLAASATSNEKAKELLAYVSIRCQTAIQAIGGLRAVALAEGDYLRDRLKKDFITVYCQSSDKDAKALPQSSTPAVQDKRESTHEPAPCPEHLKAKILGAKAKTNGSVNHIANLIKIPAQP